MSDVNGVIKLFENVFEGSFSVDWWKWKYCSNPAGFRGEEGDIWVAEVNNGDIVGHWAVIPEKMKLHSRTVTVAQAVDAATHPDYRGLGIFRTLVKGVCSDAKKRYPFIFGFPNELYRGYERLGWESFRIVEFLNFINCDIPLKSCFKNVIKFHSAKIVLKALKAVDHLNSKTLLEELEGDDVTIEKITVFPDEINDFWNSVRSEHEITLERDASFLNWRFSTYLGEYQKFVSRSAKTGEITGYAVVKRTSIRGIPDVLNIVDLHTTSNRSASLASLMKFILEIAYRERLNIVYCRIPKWHRYAKILRKLRFIAAGRLLEYGIYQPRLILYPLESNIRPDINKWFFTLADTDYA
jgi:GNAT superfamily N-acetyltransferase